MHRVPLHRPCFMFMFVISITIAPTFKSKACGGIPLGVIELRYSNEKLYLSSSFSHKHESILKKLIIIEIEY